MNVMSSYGRNFEFRVAPRAEQRRGRFVAPSATALPLGVPVKSTDTSPDSMGRLEVALATGAQAPRLGLSGVLVYEYGPAGYAGDDAALTTYSDKDTAPAGASVQVVSGVGVKVVLRNTADRTFLNTRDYEGRVMVAGLGATPTLLPGDLLTPGTGNDTDGYWAETSTASEGWLRVTAVDTARGEVEAEFLF